MCKKYIFVVAFVLFSETAEPQDATESLRDGNKGSSKVANEGGGNATDASVFDAFLSNLLAIERGDYLVKVVDSFNSFDEKNQDWVLMDRTLFHRFAFDLKEKKYLHVMAFENSLSSFAEKDRSTFGLSGFVHSKGNSYIRELPGAAAKIKKISPNELIANFKVLDLRTAGSGMFGNRFELSKKVIETLATGGGTLKSVGVSGEGVQKFRIGSATPNEKGNKFQTDIEVDLNLMTPLLFKRKMLSPKHGNDWFLMSEEKYEWQEKSSVMVPKRVEIRRPYSQVIGDKRLGAKLYTEVTAHWFSVNEKLDESRFDPDFLNDVGMMKELVDPEKQKADTLIETAKKETAEKEKRN